MAQASEKNTGAGNTVPNQGDHDRVQMLSLRADGTPDQHNPEFIGDRETSLEATREQFRQQAVSAVDVAERHTVSGGPLGGEVVEQDPKIAKVQGKVEDAAKAAESAAEKAVDALHQGDGSNTAARVPAGERKPADSK